MIKVLAPANKNPERRTLPEFHNYWAVTHGPLFVNTRALRRYVQHLTLPKAEAVRPKQIRVGGGQNVISGASSN